MARSLRIDAQFIRDLQADPEAKLAELDAKYNKAQLLVILEKLREFAASQGLGRKKVHANPAEFAYEYSGGKIIRAAHTDYIGKKLATAYRTGGNLMISMPPRHGKTSLAVEWFTLWLLAQHPDKQVIYASYEADFAAEWGAKIRGLVIEHGAALGLKLDPTQAARNLWRLQTGGGLTTAGVGGPLTGRGASAALIFDDLFKNEIEASSETTRERVDNWVQTVAFTRLEPGAPCIGIGTRWHEDDVLGRLIKRSNNGDGRLFDVINLPAIAGEDDSLGRVKGAALWPEKYPLSWLEIQRKSMTSYNWSALFQQSPAPEGGGRMKDADWRFYTPEQTPTFDQMLQSWDLSLKVGKGRDPVAGQVWGRAGTNFYLLAEAHGELDLPQVIAKCKAFAAQYPRAVLKLVEDKAAGPALMQMLRHEAVGGVVGVNPVGSKEARLEAILPLIQAGNVFLPKNSDGTLPRWVDEFCAEMRVFPQGKHEDRVDSMTMALSRMMPAGWRAQTDSASAALRAGEKPLSYKEQLNAAFHQGTREAVKEFEDSNGGRGDTGWAVDPYFGEW